MCMTKACRLQTLLPLSGPPNGRKHNISSPGSKKKCEKKPMGPPIAEFTVSENEEAMLSGCIVCSCHCPCEWAVQPLTRVAGGQANWLTSNAAEITLAFLLSTEPTALKFLSRISA